MDITCVLVGPFSTNTGRNLCALKNGPKQINCLERLVDPIGLDGVSAVLDFPDGVLQHFFTHVPLTIETACTKHDHGIFILPPKFQ